MASDAPPRERPPPASARASAALSPWPAPPQLLQAAHLGRVHLRQGACHPHLGQDEGPTGAAEGRESAALGDQAGPGLRGSAVRRSGVGEGLFLAPLTQAAGVLCALGLTPQAPASSRRALNPPLPCRVMCSVIHHLAAISLDARNPSTSAPLKLDRVPPELAPLGYLKSAGLMEKSGSSLHQLSSAARHCDQTGLLLFLFPSQSTGQGYSIPGVAESSG